MRKNLILFFIFVQSLFATSCTIEPNSNLSSNIIEIKNFEIVKKNSTNDLKLIIRGPHATINNLDNNTNIKDSLIIFSNNDDLKFQIKSDNTYINNQTSIINSKGNVRIYDLNNTKRNIKASQLTWDINNNLIELMGNVSLRDSKSKLLSESASYDLISQELIFDNIINNKIVYNTANNNQYIVNIDSEKALWDRKAKLLKFYSDINQVESIIEVKDIN